MSEKLSDLVYDAYEEALINQNETIDRDVLRDKIRAFESELALLRRAAEPIEIIKQAMADYRAEEPDAGASNTTVLELIGYLAHKKAELIKEQA